MIVRVIARGQANGSADEYLCARASSWGESAQKERAPLTSLTSIIDSCEPVFFSKLKRLFSIRIQDIMLYHLRAAHQRQRAADRIRLRTPEHLWGTQWERAVGNGQWGKAVGKGSGERQ